MRHDSDFVAENDFVCLTSEETSTHHSDDSSWIIDSGGKNHMAYDRSAFVNYHTFSYASVQMRTKETTAVVGRGSVVLKVRIDSTVVNCLLEDVLHVPSFGYFLILVWELNEKGFSTSFEKGGRILSKEEKVVVERVL